MPNTLTRASLDKIAWKPNLFDGKVVFITGGAGSICRVQGEMLVLLGANVALVGRNPEKAEKAAKEVAELRDGAKVIGIGNVDVRKVQSIAGAVEKTVAELGKIDFVIAGAAGNFLADFNHLSANAFKSVIDIDLLGSFNTAKATFKEVRKNKGHILFVSATLHYYGLPLQSHASAAKAGVDTLARALAVELGPLGIRSNVVAPGPIAGTEGMDRLSGGSKDDELTSSIPLQRMGSTEDIANATVFLFSDASSYVTGTVTVVDGGSWQTGQGGVSRRGLYPSLLISQGEDDHSKL